MNRLDPDLKRLLSWARRASSSESEDAPFGFAARAAALRKPVSRFPSLLLDLQRAAWSCAGIALMVIICGVLVLENQSHAPDSIVSFSSALSFAANNLIR